MNSLGLGQARILWVFAGTFLRNQTYAIQFEVNREGLQKGGTYEVKNQQGSSVEVVLG